MDQFHPVSFGFGGDLEMAGYYDSLPDALKRALCYHLSEFRSVDELKDYVDKLNSHEKTSEFPQTFFSYRAL